MQFSLKQLQHFVLLAEEKSFARAAIKAELSQSALSRSIQTLESSIGLRLLEREGRRVKPTSVGQRVVDRARRLLGETVDLSRELKLVKSGDLGDLSIAAGALAGAALLSGPLARLHQAHPDVLVDVDVIESQVVLERLLRSGLDFFVGEFSEISATKDIHIEVLGEMSARFFCRAAHPLAGRGAISIKELIEYRLVSVHIPVPVMRRLKNLLRTKAGTATDLPIQSGSLTILRDYALRSDAIILGTKGPFEVEVRHGLLVPLRVIELDDGQANSPIAAQVGFITVAGHTPSPSSELLMKMIRDEVHLALSALTPTANLPANHKLGSEIAK